MSGTSADGVDAALVEWPDGPEATPFRLVSFQETRFPPALQQRIHRLAAGRVEGEVRGGAGDDFIEEVPE